MHVFYLMTSVLGAACCSTHYQELIRNRGFYERQKTAHRNPPVKCSLTIELYEFFKCFEY